MKTITTILLIAIVIALGVYIIYTSLLGDKKNLQEEITENNIEPATNSEQEIIDKIRLLGAKREKDNLPILKKHLENESPLVRHAAAKAIIDTAGMEAIDSLLPIIHDPDPSVRAGTIQFLGQLKDPRLIPHLAEVIKTDQKDSVRLIAVEALRTINTPSCIPSLITATKDDSLAVRKHAHQALLSVSKTKIEATEEDFNDPEKLFDKWSNWYLNDQLEKYLSHEGIKQLEKQDTSEAAVWLQLIAWKTDLPDKTLVPGAVSALCRMTCPEAKKSFAGMLEVSTNETVCLAAINAVVAAKKKEDIPALRKLSETPDISPTIRQKLLWSLHQLRGLD